MYSHTHLRLTDRSPYNTDWLNENNIKMKSCTPHVPLGHGAGERGSPRQDPATRKEIELWESCKIVWWLMTSNRHMNLLYQSRRYRICPTIAMLTAATKAQINKYPNRNIQLTNIKASQTPDDKLECSVRVVSISNPILCRKGWLPYDAHLCGGDWF
jgi:hypothetical protein